MRKVWLVLFALLACVLFTVPTVGMAQSDGDSESEGADTSGTSPTAEPAEVVEPCADKSCGGHGGPDKGDKASNGAASALGKDKPGTAEFDGYDKTGAYDKSYDRSKSKTSPSATSNPNTAPSTANQPNNGANNPNTHEDDDNPQQARTVQDGRVAPQTGGYDVTVGQGANYQSGSYAVGPNMASDWSDVKPIASGTASKVDANGQGIPNSSNDGQVQTPAPRHSAYSDVVDDPTIGHQAGLPVKDLSPTNSDLGSGLMFGRDLPNSAVYDTHATLGSGVADLTRGANVLGDSDAETSKLGQATCSFRGDMRVRTQNGLMPISSIREGYRVLARNEITGQMAWQVVEKLHQRNHAATVEVTVQDAAGNLQTIVSNDKHPYFAQVNTVIDFSALNQSSEGHKYRGDIPQGQWLDAQALQPGYRLLGESNQWLTVQSVVYQKQPLTAYNLTVAHDHTYFIQAPNAKQGVWVHNQCIDKVQRFLDKTSIGASVLSATGVGAVIGEPVGLVADVLNSGISLGRAFMAGTPEETKEHMLNAAMYGAGALAPVAGGGVIKGAAKAAEKSNDFKMVKDSYLKANGVDAHELKSGVVGNKNVSQYDIYRDNKTGELNVMGKGGKGEAIPTGEFIK